MVTLTSFHDLLNLCGEKLIWLTICFFFLSQVELQTLDGLVKDRTQCAPNGYYFIPVYDKVIWNYCKTNHKRKREGIWEVKNGLVCIWLIQLFLVIVEPNFLWAYICSNFLRRLAVQFEGWTCHPSFLGETLAI